MARAGSITYSLILLVACGCGSNGGSADSPSARDAAADAPSQPTNGNSEPLIGSFTISLRDAFDDTPALSTMQGAVRDGPVIPPWGWSLVEERDGCRLETPDFPSCAPRCGSGMACASGEVCKPNPMALDVGEVTVSGVETASGSSEFTLSRIGPTYQPDGSIDLGFPPSPEGAELRLIASGADLPGFEIVTHGIAPLEVPTEANLPLEREQPLTIEWMPASSEATSSIEAVVDISHHGGIKGRILCVADDQSGEIVVPATLVTQLIDLGTAGFPAVKLSREAVGSTATELGRIEFSVQHEIEIGLDIPGLVSCMEASDCPDGQSCQTDFTCG